MVQILDIIHKSKKLTTAILQKFFFECKKNNKGIMNNIDLIDIFIQNYRNGNLKSKIFLGSSGINFVATYICFITVFSFNFSNNFMYEHIFLLFMIPGVDMMRVLENGYNVKMIETKFKTQAVDTRKDAKKVEKLLS